MRTGFFLPLPLLSKNNSCSREFDANNYQAPVSFWRSAESWHRSCLCQGEMIQRRLNITILSHWWIAGLLKMRQCWNDSSAMSHCCNDFHSPQPLFFFFPLICICIVRYVAWLLAIESHIVVKMLHDRNICATNLKPQRILLKFGRPSDGRSRRCNAPFWGLYLESPP